MVRKPGKGPALAVSRPAPSQTTPQPQGAPAPPAGEPLVRLIELQTIPMENGILGVAEVSKHIGFPVHRAYYIRDVQTGQSRGAHGHKNLRQ